MDRKYIRAAFDHTCDWQGLPPVYRIYVNNELFAEREWRWTEHYLEELLQIDVDPGMIDIRIEVIQPTIADFRQTNHRIEQGHARWIDPHTIEVF